ncbi:Hemin transport system permease protein HmuU [Pirellula sp. SH-Sr6A]|uniref:FecCD family ABC transporter permease n=1 Tax=Pirellula sp. SH-Sr6A TaxID=1632865 RepID=UPI00078C55D8|nr:iron ABC transporter permease [Pirellula sp. SH-Sr6A]AMV34684.1 Hemin transport system permease protein HmuU [Pirellula sp. SH-Sr6A]
MRPTNPVLKAIRGKSEWLLLASLLILGILSVVSLGIGPVTISIGTIWDWLTQSSSEGQQMEFTILTSLRLPRVLAALWTGAALAIAGVGFQCLFRNPLADPYVIGASSGAALGVAIAVIIGWRWSMFGVSPTSMFSMLGSIFTVGLVFVIGSANRGASSLTLLLAGVAISSLANALVSLLMFVHDGQKTMVILNWLLGSLAASNWQSLPTLVVLSTFGMVWLWMMARQMDAYSLGDIASQSLGLNLSRLRLSVVFAASVATAAAVSTAGVVGFVGLIAPQIARLLIGTRHTLLIPMSGLLGATITLIADAAARTVVAPAELPVGILTAMLGGPFFLGLLMRRGRSHSLLGRRGG